MKKKESRAAEPEIVYGQGRAVQWGLKQYFVPKKDHAFLDDIAKVRGWKPFGEASPKAEFKRSKHLDESIQQVERGEVFEASSAEEMCEQILGKGWREKDKVKAKTAAPAKKPHKNGLDRALEDVKAGRVHRYDSVEDMFKALGL